MEETEKRPSDDWAELVRHHGDKVSISTQECVTWKLEHPNCFGCPSELGCAKTVKLMLAMMLPLVYEPKDFEDFQKVQQRVMELQEKILYAKDKEELDRVPTV